MIKELINKIAIPNTINRRNAITNILDDNNIDYRIVGNNYKNIVVSFNESNNRLVIGAHYDLANEEAPGAMDNASACAILLNLIINNKDTNKSIDFVFFDGEEKEQLLNGSYEYIKAIGKNNIKGMINLDMCGAGEMVVATCNKSSFDIDLMNKVINDESINKVDFLPQGDYYSFINNGINSIYIVNSTRRDYLEYYSKIAYKCNEWGKTDFIRNMHSISDTVDKLNIDGILKVYNLLERCLKK